MPSVVLVGSQATRPSRNRGTLGDKGGELKDRAWPPFAARAPVASLAKWLRSAVREQNTIIICIIVVVIISITTFVI